MPLVYDTYAVNAHINNPFIIRNMLRYHGVNPNKVNHSLTYDMAERKHWLSLVGHSGKKAKCVIEVEPATAGTALYIDAVDLAKLKLMASVHGWSL